VDVINRSSRLLRSEDVSNDNASSEGKNNKQEGNAYLWRNVAVYYKVKCQNLLRINEETPEDIGHDKRYPSQEQTE
jgi:hypothetical protein